MKKIFLYSFGAAFLLASCGDSDSAPLPGSDSVPVPDSDLEVTTTDDNNADEPNKIISQNGNSNSVAVYHADGHVVYSIYKPTLFVGEATYYNNICVRMVPTLSYDGGNYVPLDSLQNYFDFYGDTTCFKVRDIGRFYSVCASPLDSINVIADKDFDSDHPAGTSLNDVLSIRYSSAYDLIQSGYDPSLDLYDFCNKGDFEVMKLSNFESIHLLDKIFYLEFDKKPDTKGRYTFDVCLGFGKDPVTGEIAEVPDMKVDIDF